MIRRLVLLAPMCALAVGAPGAAAAPTTLFTLHDRRLDEVSGIAHGIVSPDTFYVHNDSGDTARFFALDARTGRVRAVYRVSGADNVDWEDLAVAPDPAGTPSVWLADIGDNDADRAQVQLYRVPEPRVRPSATPIRTAAAQTWRLRYPDGPVDAESLAVTPSGRAFVISKVADGRSVMYAVPPHATRGVQTMRRVGALRLAAQQSLVPARYQRLATGAAVSPSGDLLVVRTYTAAFVWRLRHGDPATAIGERPRRISLPLQPQGEGVCFDADQLVLSSEGVGSTVDAVPLGARLQPSTSGATPSSTTLSPVPTTMPTPKSPATSSAPDRGARSWWASVAATAGAVVLLGVALAVRRRRRRRAGGTHTG